MFAKKELVKILIIIVLLLGVRGDNKVEAAMSDFGSFEWWADECSISEGSLNDIIYKCLGDRGYTGTFNDRLHDWLAEKTGLPVSASLNTLLVAYYVTGTRSSLPSNDLVFYNGDNLYFYDGDNALFYN